MVCHIFQNVLLYNVFDVTVDVLWSINVNQKIDKQQQHNKLKLLGDGWGGGLQSHFCVGHSFS